MRIFRFALFRLLFSILLLLFSVFFNFANAQDAKGAISGRVTSEGDGTPLPDISIAVFDQYQIKKATGTTDTSGFYRIADLSPGGYYIQAADPSDIYAPEFYDNYLYINQAKPVTVASNQDTNLDFSLAKYGSISGRVIRHSDGSPLASARVQICDSDWTRQYSIVYTDSAGNYSSKIPPGIFYVAASWGILAPAYFNNSDSQNSANPVTVVSGAETTNINLSLSVYGTVSGKVTGEDNGLPISGISIKVGGYNITRTDASGNYSIGQLSAGSYVVKAGGDSKYLGEYYDNANSESSATKVPVANDSNQTVNFQLAVGGSISGRISRNLDGAPIKDAQVYLYTNSQYYLTYVYTDAAGRYSFSGLESNTYFVSAGATGFISKYYRDAANKDSAAGIAVGHGVEASNIDLALTGYGTISGKVIRDDGTGISGIDVSAKYINGDKSFWALTNSNGEYSLSNLPPASYCISSLSNSEYLAEYFDNADTPAAATPIAISDGDNISGINLTPPKGGSISGRITKLADGTGISGASVCLYGSAWSNWSTYYADSNGYYKITGLDSGNYYLLANGNGDFKYYDNVTDRAAAILIPVVRGKNTGDINFLLTSPPTVSGRVTRERDGAGLPNIKVSAYIYINSQGYNHKDTLTDSSGYYQISEYSGGDYYVYAEGGDYLTQYYDKASSRDDASLVRLVSGADTPGINFNLKEYGYISGHITSGSAGVIDATIMLYNAQRQTKTKYTNATDSTGYYKIKLVPAQYYLKAEDPAGGGAQYYDKKALLSDANPILVNSAAVTENIDFILSASSVGSISGRVVRDKNGTGLLNTRIQAINVANWSYHTAMTDSSGYYTIPGLESGKYGVLAAESSSIWEFYDNIPASDTSPIPADAAQIEVKGGQDTPNINFGLTEYSSISGHISRESDGAAVSATCTLFDEHWGSKKIITCTGAYKFSSLVPGNYYLFVTSAGYAAQYYNNTTARSAATLIRVLPGSETPNIDIALSAGGSISGRVTSDLDGAGIPNARVSVSNIDGYWVRETRTDSSGYYKLEGLLGDHFLRVDTVSMFTGEYFDNAASSSAAAKITVVAGKDTGNINVGLATGGSISGHITCDTTKSSSFWVTVYDASWNASYWGPTIADINGNYIVSGLPAGSYYLLARTSASGCSDKYYDSATSQSEASLVVVSKGLDTPNINFNLNINGAIAGRVARDSDSAPISGVDVQAYDTGWNPIASGRTGATGDYRITNLVAGKYFLKTSNAAGYIDEYYNNAASPNAASQIEVAAGSDTPNINISLASNGSIYGQVKRASDGTPISNVSILAYNSQWSFITSTTTDAQGNYTLARLLPGAYFLQASRLGYGDLYYNNAASRNAATPVSVSPGLDATGINFSLASGGAISGRITRNSDGVGIPQALISIYKMNEEFETSALSDSSGHYIVSGLSAGSYCAQASAGSSYISEYYDNASSLDTATAFSVSNGNETDNINFGLMAEKSITGKVVRDKDGSPIEGVVVQAFSNFSAEARRNAFRSTTNNKGEYFLEGLAPGKYYLSTSNELGYVDEYYDNSSEIGATPAEVSSGAATTNVNIGLASGGSISGLVTGDSDGRTLPYSKIKAFNEQWDLVKEITNDYDGHYSITGLKPGKYYLLASSFLRTAEYYPDSPFRSGAAAITVAAEADASHIDFRLSSGGSISGSVTRDSDGTAIPNVTVQAYNRFGNIGQSALTDGSGNYTISGLFPTLYFIGTSNQAGFIDEYYDNASSLESATPINVDVYGERKIANISLATGGSISGSVESIAGAPIQDVEVRAYASYQLAKSAITDAAGAYAISGIAPGAYSVRTYNAPGYLDEFYGHAASEEDAAPVFVASGNETGDINFNLTSGLSINGTVSRDSDGAGIQGVTVSAYNSNWERVGYSTTDSAGAYSIKGLAPGDYYLWTLNSIGYIDELCENAESSDAATKINIIESSRTVSFILRSTAQDTFGKIKKRLTSE